MDYGTGPASMSVISYVDILPELTLELIFGHLKYEPETLTSCTKVSKRWDEILWTKKDQFLFHLVLPLLVNRLSYQDLMHCRLTSRSWKDAVDGLNYQVPEWDHNIYRLGLQTSLPFARASIRGLAFSGWSEFDYGEEKNPERFMKYIRYPPADENPFPTRVVVFENMYGTSWNLAPAPEEMCYRHAYSDPRFNISLERCKYFQLILGLYGGNISHLVYSIRSHFHLNCDLSPKYLVNMLQFLPQLQSLTVIGAGSRCTDYWNHPVPTLSKLVSLTIRFHENSPAIAHFLLTSFGKQLQSLECEDEDLLLLPQAHNGNAFTFPNLKNLKFLPIMWPSAQLNSRFQKFKFSMAPCLERLSFKLRHFENDSMTLFNLITGLSTLSSTMVELYVDVLNWRRRCPTSKEASKRDLMNFHGTFPRLKIFQINSSISPVSDEFLLVLSKLPALQTLIVLQKYTGTGTPIVTEFEQVWMASPSLQRLYVRPAPLQMGGVQQEMGPLICFSRKK